MSGTRRQPKNVCSVSQRKVAPIINFTRVLKRKLLYLFFVTILLTESCVRDDTSTCGDLIRLDYVYTMNEERTNQFSSAIQDIRIFAYDARTGVLVREFRADSEDIRRGFDMISLPDGDYFLVGWASSNPDLFQVGFKHVQIVPGAVGPPDIPLPPSEPPVIPDSLGHPTGPPIDIGATPPPVFVPATPGQTTLDDSRLVPDTNPASGGGNTPSNDQFGDVFNSDPEQGTIRDGRSTEEIEMDFMRNSAIIETRIRGLENLPADVNRPLNVFMLGRNGALMPNGTVDTNAPLVRYEAYSRATSATEMELHFQTLKLELTKETTQPMLLYIQDPVTGRDIVSPINVQTLLRSVRGADGQLLYPNQEAIDRETEFRIQLDFPAPGERIRTTVNDFTVEQLTPIVDGR